MAESPKHIPPKGNQTPVSSGVGAFRAQLALLCGALAAVFLAGGPMEGGMGIFLTISGVVMLVIRPIQHIPRLLWVAAAVLMLAACSSMIPQEWLGHLGVRASIRPVSILSLPTSISLEPRTTIFWILLMGLSLLIFFNSLGSPPNSRGIGSLALFAVLGCAFYALLALKSWQTGWIYPFFDKPAWAQSAFGFFPNRNHTAGFLLTGAILSLGLIYRGVSGRGVLQACIAACAFSLLVSVLLFNSVSRGGMVFLVVGVLIWLGGLGRHRSRTFLFGFLAVMVVVMMLFLSSGSSLLERLKGGSPGTDSKTELSAPSFAEIRLKIWEDTLSIIADYPLTGTGFGTYPLVYPFYADKSLRDQSTALHAESDWLTLCAENGIPMLILAAGFLILLISRLPRIAANSGSDWPVRWAFIAAFLTELLHGLIDVPLHKPELGWWVMLLGGIGFGVPAGRQKASPKSLLIQRLLFALGGVVAIMLGFMMIRAQWCNGTPLPPFAARVLQQKIVNLYDKGDPDSAEKAIREARRAIGEYPMNHAFYFQLAKMLLNSEKNVSESTQLLEAEQAVSPNDPDFVFVDGWLLAEDAPMTTATFWNEALRRQLAYDESPNSTIHRTGDLYQQMISTALANWPLFDRLPALASNRELRMIWLSQPYCNAIQTAEAVRDHDFMDSLSDKEKGQLISLWWQRGEKQEVEIFLEGHPEYEHASLNTRLAILTASGNEEKACRLLIESFQIPVPELTDQSPSTTRPAEESEIPGDPLAAAIYYRKIGNDTASQRYLADALNGTSRSDALRFRGVLEMRAGEWKAALADLISYLKATGNL